MRKRLAALSLAGVLTFGTAATSVVAIAPVAHADPNVDEDPDGCNALCVIGKAIGKIVVVVVRAVFP